MEAYTTGSNWQSKNGQSKMNTICPTVEEIQQGT